jgi:hypothetical protein
MKPITWNRLKVYNFDRANFTVIDFYLYEQLAVFVNI